MKTCHRSPRRLPPAPTLLAAAIALACPLAHADDPNPYFIGVSQAFTHDSNIYRFADPYTTIDPLTLQPTTSPQPIGDTISSTGVVAGVDQPFGRQHFYASGSARSNHYRDNTDLNNTSYNLDTGLDWSTVERLSGKLSYVANENLASTSNQVLNSREKNLEHDQAFKATGQLGVAALVALTAGYTHDTVHYSAASYQTFNYHDDVYELGLKYRPSGALTLGVDGRATRGAYPDRPTASGVGTQELTLHRNDVDLTAEWDATGLSSLIARLSYGHLSYGDDRGDDFHGFTGSLGWDYRPTGKLRFSTYLARDTGQTALASTFLGQTFSADSSHLRTLLQVRGIWDLTGKIQLTGTGRYEHRSFSRISVFSPDGATDNTHLYSLGIQYVPLRSLTLACNVSRESRSSDTISPLSYPLHDNITGCSAQFTLQ